MFESGIIGEGIMEAIIFSFLVYVFKG